MCFSFISHLFTLLLLSTYKHAFIVTSETQSDSHFSTMLTKAWLRTQETFSPGMFCYFIFDHVTVF